jgi:hypothetical protein
MNRKIQIKKKMNMNNLGRENERLTAALARAFASNSTAGRPEVFINS